MSRSLQKGFLCYPSGQVHSSIWMEYGPNPLEIPSKRFGICLFASEWASRLQKTAPTWSNKGHPIGSRCWLPVYMILRSCPRLLGLFYSEVCHCVGIKQIAESSPVEMRICTQFSMVVGSCLSMNECKGLLIIGKCIKSLHNNKGLWWWCTWQIWSEMEMQIVANFSESCNAFPQNMGTFQEGRRQEFEKALWIWRLSIALKRPLGLANLSISFSLLWVGEWLESLFTLEDPLLTLSSYSRSMGPNEQQNWGIHMWLIVKFINYIGCGCFSSKVSVIKFHQFQQIQFCQNQLTGHDHNTRGHVERLR